MPAAWRNSTGFSDTGASASIVLQYDAAVLAGSLLWCGVGHDAGATITGVADDVNGAWTQAGTELASEFGNLQSLWYRENSSAGTPTVTVSLSASVAFRQLAITEVTGVATSSALDKIDQDTTNSASPTTGPVTTTTDGQYIAVVLFTAGSRPITDYGGYTSRDLTDAENEVMDQVQTSAGSISAALTLTSSNVWTMHMATFKAAGGGSGLLLKMMEYYG